MEKKFFKISHRLILGAVVSLLFSASLLLFGPLNLYINESDNLWFSFSSIILPVIIITLICFIIVTLITSLPKENIHKLLCCLVFGVGLALYLQGNFFNISYGSGTIDGSQIAWKDYTTYGAIDCAMWAACIALPFAIVMVFKSRWRAILITASVALIAIQTFTLTTNILSNKDDLNKANCEVTTEGIYDLSKKDNTIIFVLDSLDQQYFEKMVKEDKSQIKELTGFTEYTNTLAGGAKLIEAFPAMISGEAFKKETKYVNYIDDIWSNKNVFYQLKKNGVDTRIFANPTFFGDGATRCVENIKDSTKNPEANFQIVKTIYKYTFFEFAQHYLKPYFWVDKSIFNTYVSKDAYKQDDAEFLMNFENSLGFDYKSDYDHAIRIYDLQGTATPYILTTSGKRNTDGTSLFEQIRGSFSIVSKMIKDLKENKAYTNSTIIITSACGDKALSQNPLLLIKKSGEDKGFEKNNSPVSLLDFPATLSSLVNKNFSASNNSTFFNIDADTPRERHFFLNTGVNNDTRIEEYKTTKEAKDSSSIELINFYRTNNGIVNEYELGNLLTFDIDATANAYCTEGFRSTTGWRTPLAGPLSVMTIPIKNIPSDAQDLHVYFNVSQVDKNTTIQIMADGVRVYQGKTNDDLVKTGINFTVPSSLVKSDNELKLQFIFAGIDKKELDKKINDRTMTISFESFKIYTQ